MLRITGEIDKEEIDPNVCCMCFMTHENKLGLSGCLVLVEDGSMKTVMKIL